MINRFIGPDGKALLLSALCKQQIIKHNQLIAEKIAQLIEQNTIELSEIASNQEIIKQDCAKNDIYLIISGKVSIRVNGRQVATRHTGCHVGEMTLIDSTAKRCASVVTTEESVIAKITEPVFSELANEHPQLWRELAVELSNRLRERGNQIIPPNQKPYLFIGSSAEYISIIREIQQGLTHDNILVTPWTQGVFQATQHSLESLTKQTQVSDFAALLLSKDDSTTSRSKKKPSPRDNVIFELGLFMGALGRQRTILIKERGTDIKIPSDLLGITLLEFASGTTDTLTQRIGPICTEIKKIVDQLGPK